MWSQCGDKVVWKLFLVVLKVSKKGYGSLKPFQKAWTCRKKVVWKPFRKAFLKGQCRDKVVWKSFQKAFLKEQCRDKVVWQLFLARQWGALWCALTILKSLLAFRRVLWDAFPCLYRSGLQMFVKHPVRARVIAMLVLEILMLHWKLVWWWRKRNWKWR